MFEVNSLFVGFPVIHLPKYCYEVGKCMEQDIAHILLVILPLEHPGTTFPDKSPVSPDKTLKHLVVHLINRLGTSCLC